MGACLSKISAPDDAVRRFERERIIIPVQRHGSSPALDLLFKLVAQLPTGEGLVLLFAALYWSLRARYHCVYGIFLVPICEVMNGCIKWSFRNPRPGWADAAVQMKAWSHEYSFPSSHAQLMGALSTFFGATMPSAAARRLWLWLTGLVMCSRVYEGVHYPRDVVAGCALGWAVARVYMHLLPHLRTAAQRATALQLFVALGAVPAAMGVVLAACYRRVLAAPPDSTKLWLHNAAKGKHAQQTLKPREYTLPHYVGMLGVLGGLAVSLPLIRRIPLADPRSTREALVRLFVGNALLLGGFFGVRALTPAHPMRLVMLARFLRYGYVPVCVLLLAPKVFARLRLAA